MRVLMLASFGLETVECEGTLALHQQFDRSPVLVNGLAGHSGAVLGEAYLLEGVFELERLQG